MSAWPARYLDLKAGLGRLFLFYGTPRAPRARQVVGRVVDALRANGFADAQLVSRSATAVGCIAHLA